MKIDRFVSSLPSVDLSPELKNKVKVGGAQESSTDFGDLLVNKIGETDQLQKAAEAATEDLATGKTRNIHEAILAMEMADTSLRLMVTVRNKAIEAYQEIMRMPV